MPLSEFDIIKEFFASRQINTDLVTVGIGDDAAVINTRSDEQLLISVDTLNIGVHFPQQTSAFDIGYKALAVNLSDIAAMGGVPKWFTLAMSLPEANHDWLEAFTEGLSSLAQQYQLSLVGGDTTRGPLSITIQIAGTVPTGQSLKRRGARVEDNIYVTGTLGDAAAALMLCQNKLSADANTSERLLQRLNHPMPRISIGQALRGIATSCIDVSDGLAADLGHILEASGVGAELLLTALPRSTALNALLCEEAQLQDWQLYGGDDYELCFTAPASQHDQVMAISLRENCPITRVGKIIREAGMFCVDDEQHTPVVIRGYDHFGGA
ncbi:MAG: thiamine-phosphate kinase [Gammaproteobacteria bacterium]|nr:thiamine-phosphate kinase [Gammaproteobacteria bacterium]